MTKTNYFLLAYPGHGGGDWFTLMCNNHPAGMTVVLEGFKDQMLDFEARGLDRRKDLDRELLRLMKFRDGKDACVGFLKSEHPAVWREMLAHGGRRIQVIRNPIALIGTRMWRKVEAATRWIKKRYGREPQGDDDMFEGHVMRYAYGFYEMYLKRAQSKRDNHWPLIRLEDMNRSVGTDGQYFLRVVEWLTQTEWPRGYLRVIRKYYTPAYGSCSMAIFDEDYNVIKLLAWPHLRWRERFQTESEWGEDVSHNSPPYHWENWSEEWRRRYLKHMLPLEKRLGYNQDHIGSTDPDWECRDAFGEVDE